MGQRKPLCHKAPPSVAPFQALVAPASQSPGEHPNILRMKRMSGFTLIEALVTMTVVAVLVSAAVPSFKTSIQNGRLVTQANDLLGALLYARSQAVASTGNVVVCTTTDNSSCSSAGNWANGWLVATTDSSGAIVTVLRVQTALAGNNTLTNDASVKKITFTKGSGIPTAGTNIYFTLCDSRGKTFGRSIYLSQVGEARVSPTVGYKIDSTAIGSC